MVARTLMWPVIALVVIGLTHLGAEWIWPNLQSIFIPAVVGPVLLAAGAWVGRNAAQSGGGFVTVVVAGAIVGLLPLALDIVGFGMLLDRGTEAGQLGGTFGFLMVFWGSLLGGGYSLSK